MKTIIRLIALAFALIAMPAHAGVVIDEVAGWSIIQEENGCSIQMEYEGPGSSKLTFGKLNDVGIGVMVENYNWTAKKGEKYDISLVLDDQVYTGTGFGFEGEGIYHGFLILMEDDFEQHLRNGKSLRVYLDETRIDQLSLTGSSAAITSMNQCYARIMRKKAAELAEKRRWEKLPEDPFAKKPE